MTALKDNKFFYDLDSIDFVVLEEYWQERTYRKGDVILEQGQPGIGLFLIVKGTVSITSRFPGGVGVFFGKLGIQDFFGEVSLLDAGPCSATITADTPTVCMFLDRNILIALRLTFPGIAARLVYGLGRYSAERISAILMTLPELLQHIPPTYRVAFTNKKRKKMQEKKLLRHSKPFTACIPSWLEDNTVLTTVTKSATIPGNTVLFSGDDSAGCIYYILEGSVQLAFEAHNMYIKLDVLSPQDFTGILPWFGQKTHGFAAVVREYAKVMLITYQDLEALQHTHPLIFYKLQNAMSVSMVSTLRSINKQLLRIRSELDISMSVEIT